MARRGSSKALSVDHEEHIAKLYGGKRSPSSGGHVSDQGDVRCPTLLIECKMTGKPGKPVKKAKIVKDMEKISEEAWSEGREPALALRYFDPTSILADPEGWVDLIVRRAGNEG